MQRRKRNGSVDLNKIFNNLHPNTSVSNQGFTSGQVNLIVLGKEIDAYIGFPLHANSKNGKFNTTIDFSNGTDVNRTIHGKTWVFYKNTTFQWGTTYENYYFFRDWLEY